MTNETADSDISTQQLIEIMESTVTNEERNMMTEIGYDKSEGMDYYNMIETYRCFMKD